MKHPLPRWILLLCGALVIALLLACQPYLSQRFPEVMTQPVAWQCPTPSPIPTIILGYRATPTPVGEAEPIYSTPVPTATPYIRTGADYYLAQRIQRGPIIFSVVGYQTRTGRTVDESLHLIDLLVENSAQEPVELHFEQMSFIRTLRRVDGRLIEGAWYPTRGAAVAAGVPLNKGVWPSGITRATIAIAGPAGTAESWGMPFVDSPQRRNGSSGDGYVWVRIQPDPHCSFAAGGPPTDPYSNPLSPGLPRGGRGRWSVASGITISRGYGCHPFFTGIRGQCGPSQWWHDGVDFAAPLGTPIYAVHDSTIEIAGEDMSMLDCSALAGSQPPHRGFGIYIKARDEEGYVYWYGHLRRTLVRAGEQVIAGQQIGEMGSTGCSTGSHLHLRIRLNGIDRNPFDVIAEQ